MQSVRKSHRFTIHRTLVGNEPFGTHKCVPYVKIIVLRFIEPWWVMNLSERINAFPTNKMAQMLPKTDGQERENDSSFI